MYVAYTSLKQGLHETPIVPVRTLIKVTEPRKAPHYVRNPTISSITFISSESRQSNKGFGTPSYTNRPLCYLRVRPSSSYGIRRFLSFTKPSNDSSDDAPTQFKLYDSTINPLTTSVKLHVGPISKARPDGQHSNSRPGDQHERSSELSTYTINAKA
eukprot:9488205-Pyramimonas_sp.AAC.2